MPDGVQDSHGLLMLSEQELQKEMQVILKQNLQQEQAMAVLDTIRHTNTFLTVLTNDGDISINRALLLVCSPFLRSVLESVPSSATFSLVLPSVNSKSIINLEKLLMDGSLSNPEQDRVDVEDIVEAGLLLGVELTNLLKDFDKFHSQQEEEHLMNQPINEGIEKQVINETAVTNAQSSDIDFQIKVEPEVAEYLELVPDSVIGGVKAEATKHDELQAGATEGGDDIFSPGDAEVFSVEETFEEEGEIIDASDSINIETNQTEIEYLLNATKSEIEKFLVARNPTEKAHGTDGPKTPQLCLENEQSSTSLKSSTRGPANTSVQPLEEESIEYRYPCNLCGYKTNVGFNIKKHMKSIHKCFYTFKCTNCIFETSSEEKFKLHSCDVSSESKTPDNSLEAKFQCSLCSFKTHMADFIKVHMKNNHDALHVFKCSQCDFETSQYHKLSNHPCSTPKEHTVTSLELPTGVNERAASQKKSKGTLHTCKECGYTTNKASMIKYHARKSHQSRHLFTCNVCMFSTTDNNMFPSHTCKEEDIQCPQCDFTSKKILLVKRHIASQHEPQVYACGQCAYKCETLDSFKKHQLLYCKGNSEDIHGQRNYRTTANVSSHQQSSRGDLSPNTRSLTPPRRRGTYSPDGRSHSRQRNPSNRSQTSSRGPTTPFPPPARAHGSPVPAQHRMPASSRAMTSRRRPEPKPKTSILLCLRCGRRHASSCKYPDDSRCTQPGCGMTGHVVTLHHPKTLNDYKVIRSKAPGVAVNKPSELSESVTTRRRASTKDSFKP